MCYLILIILISAHLFVPIFMTRHRDITDFDTEMKDYYSSSIAIWPYYERIRLFFSPESGQVEKCYMRMMLNRPSIEGMNLYLTVDHNSYEIELMRYKATHYWQKVGTDIEQLEVDGNSVTRIPFYAMVDGYAEEFNISFFLEWTKKDGYTAAKKNAYGFLYYFEPNGFESFMPWVNVPGRLTNVSFEDIDLLDGKNEYYVITNTDTLYGDILMREGHFQFHKSQLPMLPSHLAFAVLRKDKVWKFNCKPRRDFMPFARGIKFHIAVDEQFSAYKDLERRPICALVNSLLRFSKKRYENKTMSNHLNFLIIDDFQEQELTVFRPGFVIIKAVEDVYYKLRELITFGIIYHWVYH